jgi:hypothetical protein
MRDERRCGSYKPREDPDEELHHSDDLTLGSTDTFKAVLILLEAGLSAQAADHLLAARFIEGYGIAVDDLNWPHQ